MLWYFYSTAMSESRKRWIWVCEAPDHAVIKRSGRSFESYAACLVDALAHGYSMPAEPAQAA